MLPYHKALDKAGEARRALNKIGTTGRGIGPAYEDKAARTGIRACDLADPKLLESKIKHALIEKTPCCRGFIITIQLMPMRLSEAFCPSRPGFCPISRIRTKWCTRQLTRTKIFFFEGAQGIHLDMNHGTYPFVTSSNTVAGGACAGGGIAPSDIDRIIGVVKSLFHACGFRTLPDRIAG